MRQEIKRKLICKINYEIDSYRKRWSGKADKLDQYVIMGREQALETMRDFVNNDFKDNCKK